MKLSVIIPIFDEKDTIDAVYEKLLTALAKTAHEFEILFVNDGSRDGSQEKLDAVASRDERIKVIHFRRNFGQTAAMMAGIDFSSGDIIIPMDGDLQNDPEDIPRLLEKLDEGYDVVSGWRKERHDNPLKRVFLSRIANMMISALSGVRLHDYGCTLKAYKKDVIKGIKLYGEMHRFVPIYTKWQGATVTEIPVTHHRRTHGRSKYGLNRTFKVIMDLLVILFIERFAEKPIYIFGGFGFFSLVLAFIAFLLMVYYKFWGAKTFVETPLPLLAVIFGIIGIQSILLGLIAEILNRTYHESQNKPIYQIREMRNVEGKRATESTEGKTQDA